MRWAVGGRQGQDRRVLKRKREPEGMDSLDVAFFCATVSSAWLHASASDLIEGVLGGGGEVVDMHRVSG